MVDPRGVLPLLCLCAVLCQASPVSKRSVEDHSKEDEVEVIANGNTYGADVVLLLDTSGPGITPNIFMKDIVGYVKNVSSYLSLGKDGFQFGLVALADNASMTVPLNASHDKASLAQNIAKFNYDNRNSNISEALRKMYMMFKHEMYGSRKHYPKIGILLTDGLTATETMYLEKFMNMMNKTEDMREHMEMMKMIVVTIGDIRNHTSYRYLANLVSTPTSEYLHMFNSSAQLHATSAHRFASELIMSTSKKLWEMMKGENKPMLFTPGPLNCSTLMMGNGSGVNCTVTIPKRASTENVSLPIYCMWSYQNMSMGRNMTIDRNMTLVMSMLKNMTMMNSTAGMVMARYLNFTFMCRARLSPLQSGSINKSGRIHSKQMNCSYTVFFNSAMTTDQLNMSCNLRMNSTKMDKEGEDHDNDEYFNKVRKPLNCSSTVDINNVTTANCTITLPDQSNRTQLLFRVNCTRINNMNMDASGRYVFWEIYYNCTGNITNSNQIIAQHGNSNKDGVSCVWWKYDTTRVLTSATGSKLGVICSWRVMINETKPPKPVMKGADVMLILDNSLQITSNDFRKYVVEYVKNISKLLPLGREAFQLGVVTTANNASFMLPLSKGQNFANFSQEIDKLVHSKAGSNVTEGLRKLRNGLFDRVYGGRDGYPKIGMFLTDGLTEAETMYLDNELRMLNQLKDESKIMMFVLTFGNLTNQPTYRTLTQIASAPAHGYVYSIPTVTMLANPDNSRFMAEIVKDATEKMWEMKEEMENKTVNNTWYTPAPLNCSRVMMGKNATVKCSLDIPIKMANRNVSVPVYCMWSGMDMNVSMPMNAGNRTNMMNRNMTMLKITFKCSARLTSEQTVGINRTGQIGNKQMNCSWSISNNSSMSADMNATCCWMIPVKPPTNETEEEHYNKEKYPFNCSSKEYYDRNRNMTTVNCTVSLPDRFNRTWSPFNVNCNRYNVSIQEAAGKKYWKVYYNCTGNMTSNSANLASRGSLDRNGVVCDWNLSNTTRNDTVIISRLVTGPKLMVFCHWFMAINTTNATVTPAKNETDWKCDFEQNEPQCLMIRQESRADQLDWVIHSGNTQTWGTGPERAYSGSNYIYMEATNSNPKDTAIMYLPSVNTTGMHCLSLYYYMVGAEMGTLMVNMGNITMWTKQGDQGKKWNKARVNVFLNPYVKLSITGVRGQGQMSDIALDDIELEQKMCKDCMVCTKACSYGLVMGSDGCPKCECAPAPSPLFPCWGYKSCSYNQTCVSKQVFCFTSPCYPVPTCVDGNNRTTPYPVYNQTTTRPGSTASNFTRTDRPTMTTTSSPVGPSDRVLVRCTFDDPHNGMCNMSEQGTLKFIRRQGSTPSGETGPARAHSGQSYIYLEATDTAPGQTAVLSLPRAASPGEYCLTFYYNMFDMYGGMMGSLSVQAVSATTETVWSKTGNQGNQWKKADVRMNVTTSAQMHLVATRGTGFRSDIALDDIEMYMCGAGLVQSTTTRSTPSVSTTRVPPTNTTTSVSSTSKPVTTTTVGQILSWFCGFELNDVNGPWCSMEQASNDQFDWTRNDFNKNKGRTPSGTDWDKERQAPVTGPETAHTGNNYMFIEASSPRQLNDRAIVYLPPAKAATDFCLSFFYNMNGFHVNTLQVVRFDAGAQTYNMVWQKVGDSTGNNQKWMEQSILLSNVQVGSKVGFLGIRGRGYTGDIAIDSINISNDLANSKCRGVTAVPQSTTPNSGTTRPSTKSTIQPPAGCSGKPCQNNGLCIEILGMVLCDCTNTQFTGQYCEKPKSTPVPSTTKPTIVSTTTASTTAPLAPVSWSCGFESNDVNGPMCGLQQSTSDIFDWSRNDFTKHNGRTPSAAGSQGWDLSTNTTVTGPERAQSGQNYMYIESSGPRKQADQAIVYLPAMNTSAALCLSFYYDMTGFHINELQVVRSSVGSQVNTVVWNMKGGNNQHWVEKSVLLEQVTPSTMFGFNGIRGSGYTGDIAVDTISVTSDITNSKCQGMTTGAGTTVKTSTPRPGTSPQTTVPSTTINTSSRPPSSSPSTTVSRTTASTTQKPGTTQRTTQSTTAGAPVSFSCGFEDNESGSQLCGLIQSTSDVFDWSRNNFARGQGRTPSGTGAVGWNQQANTTVTGPERAQSGDYYMYVETSGPRSNGDQATIYLPALTTGGTMCLSFYYNMNGFHINELQVMRSGTGASTMVWSDRGNQGQKWIEQNLILDQLTSNTQIGFTGIRGGGYMGDIAVDSIKLTTDLARCQGGVTPVTTTSTARPVTTVSTTQAPQPSTTRQSTTTTTQSTTRPSITTTTQSTTTAAAVKTTAATSQPSSTVSPGGGCSTNPCSNGGLCVTVATTFVCDCTNTGFDGPRCQNAVQPVFSWSCDFESSSSGGEWCNTVQVVGRDVFNWTRGSDSTPSNPTGPNKAQSGNNYIYIEASGKNNNDNATLMLPPVDRSGVFCLSFYYHMFGFHIKELRVDTMFVEQPNQYIKTWSKVGDPAVTETDQSWHLAKVPLYLLNQSQVAFTGIVNGEYTGDIAVDNIVIQTGVDPAKCQ